MKILIKIAFLSLLLTSLSVWGAKKKQPAQSKEEVTEPESEKIKSKKKPKVENKELPYPSDELEGSKPENYQEPQNGAVDKD